MSITKYYNGFTRFPLKSAICLVDVLIVMLAELVFASKLTPAGRNTTKSKEKSEKGGKSKIPKIPIFFRINTRMRATLSPARSPLKYT